MNYYARFNSTDFVITQLSTLNDSASQTSFSSLEIDFRGYAETLLPIQYQEITIVQIDESLNETILYVGYCDSVEYPEFNFENQPFKLTINLLSPYAYASKRSVSTQINTVALNTAITTILQTLIDDGFTIEVNELSTALVSEIFQNETVEKVMNYLANKFNFTWYIDSAKKIYLKDIDLLIGQDPIVVINDEDKCYLKTIKPTKTVVDYANRLNIKNVKIIGGNAILLSTVLAKDSTYNFDYPISISQNVAYRLPYFMEEEPNLAYSFYLSTNVSTYKITIDIDLKTITYDSTIGFAGVDDNNASKKVLLITDTNDTTLVTGFRWNANSETTDEYIGLFSASFITPYQAVYIDPVEIGAIKDKINTSGVIEKIIDANGKYMTGEELFNYATSLFTQNNVQTNEIKAIFKGKLSDSSFIAVRNNLKIGNVISVNLPTFLVDGRFIITSTEYSANTETATITINAKNYNLNESFLDIFRKSITQESEDTLTQKMIVLYNQDNKTVLDKQIIVNGEVVNNE
jgi:hypothetical protein